MACLSDLEHLTTREHGKCNEGSDLVQANTGIPAARTILMVILMNASSHAIQLVSRHLRPRCKRRAVREAIPLPAPLVSVANSSPDSATEASIAGPTNFTPPMPATVSPQQCANSQYVDYEAQDTVRNAALKAL